MLEQRVTLAARHSRSARYVLRGDPPSGSRQLRLTFTAEIEAELEESVPPPAAPCAREAEGEPCAREAEGEVWKGVHAMPCTRQAEGEGCDPRAG